MIQVLPSYMISWGTKVPDVRWTSAVASAARSLPESRGLRICRAGEPEPAWTESTPRQSLFAA